MNIATNIYNSLRGLMRRLGNQRLKSKLFLVYLLVTILPILSLVVFSYQLVRDQLIRQAEVNVNSTIDQININVLNRLDTYSQISTLIYLDNLLRNYLLHTYGPDDLFYLDAYDYINQTLYKMMAMYPNLTSISIYTDNRTIRSDGLFIRYTEDLPDDMKRKIMAAEGKITSFVTTSEDGADTITLARALNYLSLNYPYGILLIEFSERELYSLIVKESNNKSIFIADEQGAIITSGRQDRQFRHLSELETAGNKVMAKKLPNGWQTVVLLSYDELLREARTASAKMLIASLACVAAAVVLIYVTSRFMTKRIEILFQAIRKVERGSFDLGSQSMGEDEIGQLWFALNKMAYRMKELIQDVYTKEAARNEAEMTSLQAQISPHFLYNTLASISALALRYHNPLVHQMADDLARFYRISLSKGKKTVTIEHEIELTKHYISIQKVRFSGMFHVHYDLDESLFSCTTLKLIIQPFIENCLNHAIWDDESGIHVIIKLTSEEQDILISVIDDGMGMTRETLERLRSRTDVQPAGYGIYNVDKRIKLAYGERYGVELFSRLGIGTTVRIRIPKTTHYL
jgi:Predicted signal transduction protein with a C-terminal ATPase domain